MGDNNVIDFNLRIFDLDNITIKEQLQLQNEIELQFVYTIEFAIEMAIFFFEILLKSQQIRRHIARLLAEDVNFVWLATCTQFRIGNFEFCIGVFTKLLPKHHHTNITIAYFTIILRLLMFDTHRRVQKLPPHSLKPNASSLIYVVYTSKQSIEPIPFGGKFIGRCNKYFNCAQSHNLFHY